MKKISKILIILLLIFCCYFVLTHFIYNTQITINSNQPTKEVKKDYSFRNKSLLQDHFDKHGKEMGFKTKEEYELAATYVIDNPKALHKKEKEDNDDLYYLEETNEYVVLSKDGYIRTYFKPDRGKEYFDSK